MVNQYYYESSHYELLGNIVNKIGDIDHWMPESVSIGIPYIMTGDFDDADSIKFSTAKKISHDDYSGLPIATLNSAWFSISPKYGINGGDYLTLSQNLPAMEEFWKLCDNRHTQDIRNLMEAFKEPMKDEGFDTHFKKYIKMNQL